MKLIEKDIEYRFFLETAQGYLDNAKRAERVGDSNLAGNEFRAAIDSLRVVDRIAQRREMLMLFRVSPHS